jgi:DNA polymerase-3 subunit gamma/tau
LDAGARETAAREAPARTTLSARSGVIDADTLRQRWPDVLEAVKSERRVAWMLLNDASVDSLAGGVLTVAFASEGKAKGFAASGHDQVLTGVLATMLGLKVRVRAAVGTVSGARGARPAPADPASRAGASGRATGPGAAGPAGATDRPGGAADRPDGAADGPGAPGAPGVMPGGRGTPPAGSQASSRRPGGSSGAGGGAAGRAPAAPRPPEPRSRGAASSPGDPAAADLTEEWPDDAGPAESGAGPTGMALIERQLGGTIIEEIDEP